MLGTIGFLEALSPTAIDVAATRKRLSHRQLQVFDILVSDQALWIADLVEYGEDQHWGGNERATRCFITKRNGQRCPMRDDETVSRRTIDALSDAGLLIDTEGEWARDKRWILSDDVRDWIESTLNHLTAEQGINQ